MKRDELKKLGVEDEVIEKIMALHGKTIETKKSELEAMKTENETLKTQMTETQKKIKEFEGMDIEGIQTARKELEEKYKADTEALNQKLESQKVDFAMKEYLSNFKFANELTKKAVTAEFKEKGFKLDGEKFLGADDFMKELQESQPTAFQVEKQKADTPSFGSATENNSGGGSEEKSAFERGLGL